MKDLPNPWVHFMYWQPIKCFWGDSVKLVLFCDADSMFHIRDLKRTECQEEVTCPKCKSRIIEKALENL